MHELKVLIAAWKSGLLNVVWLIEIKHHQNAPWAQICPHKIVC